MRESEIGVESNRHRRFDHAAIQSPKQAGKPPPDRWLTVAFLQTTPAILVFSSSIGHRGARHPCGSNGGVAGWWTWRARTPTKKGGMGDLHHEILTHDPQRTTFLCWGISLQYPHC